MNQMLWLLVLIANLVVLGIWIIVEPLLRFSRIDPRALRWSNNPYNLPVVIHSAE